MNAKDKDLKELWHDLSSKNKFFESVRHKLLYFPHRYKFMDTQQDLVAIVVALGCRGSNTGGTAPGFAVFPTISFSSLRK